MPYTLIHNFVMLYILSSAIIRSKCSLWPNSSESSWSDKRKNWRFPIPGELCVIDIFPIICRVLSMESSIALIPCTVLMDHKTLLLLAVASKWKAFLSVFSNWHVYSHCPSLHTGWILWLSPSLRLWPELGLLSGCSWCNSSGQQ